MSLIQEALRRRGEETGAPLALKPPVEVTPPPLPPPPPPPARRVGLWLLVTMVLVIVTIGAVAWWLVQKPSGKKVVETAKVVQKPVPPPVAKPPVAPTNPPVVAAQSAAPTNAPATNNIIAKVQAVLEKTVTPERRELVMGATNTPVAVTSAPPLVAASTAPVAQPVPTTPPPAPRKTVRWPKLTITGVMARSSGHAMVFVNGQMLASGDEIQGVSVIQVTETGARFVYQNETNFVRVGHSTE